MKPPANYYDVLAVDEAASQETIQHVYRQLSRAYHPDANSQHRNAAGEERIKLINVAYETLRNPDRRARHDRELREFRRASGRPHAAARTSTAGRQHDSDHEAATAEQERKAQEQERQRAAAQAAEERRARAARASARRKREERERAAQEKRDRAKWERLARQKEQKAKRKKLLEGALTEYRQAVADQADILRLHRMKDLARRAKRGVLFREKGAMTRERARERTVEAQAQLRVDVAWAHLSEEQRNAIRQMEPASADGQATEGPLSATSLGHESPPDSEATVAPRAAKLDQLRRQASGKRRRNWDDAVHASRDMRTHEAKKPKRRPAD